MQVQLVSLITTNMELYKPSEASDMETQTKLPDDK
jgi:hypothetical protein